MKLIRNLFLVSLLGVSGTAWCQAKKAPAKAPAKAAAKKPAAEDKQVEKVNDLIVSTGIKGVPFHRQLNNFSGEACISMFLAKLGHKLPQTDVFALGKADPAAARGCSTGELAQALTSMGFRAADGTVIVEASLLRQKFETELNKILAELKRSDAKKNLPGIPSVIKVRIDDKTERFILLLGIDTSTGRINYHDPARATGRYNLMTKERLFKIWPSKTAQNNYMFERVRIWADPTLTKVPKPAVGITDGVLVQYIMARTKQKPEGFNIALHRPFVLVGNESEAKLQERGTQVAWAVSQLTKTYFPEQPSRVYTIWMCKDKESYESLAQKSFGVTPKTHRGYWSRRYLAIGLNVGRTSSIAHLLVHPYLDANFPKCPFWFREGLSSLYESAVERDGAIVGLNNWRVSSLQRAIRRRRVPTLDAFLKLSDRDFREDITGTNTAHARYLCFYLQQRGLLQKYYQELAKDIATDPTGSKTLLKVLNIKSLAELRREWTGLVLRLPAAN